MEKFPSQKTAEEIQAEIAEIDREIIASEDPLHLSDISANNELGTSLEESGLEEESNERDFAQEAAKIKHLRDRKQELQNQLNRLQEAA